MSDCSAPALSRSNAVQGNPVPAQCATVCSRRAEQSRAEHQDKAEIGFEQQPPASSIICWTRLICSPSHLELKPISNHSSCLLSHLSSHNIRLGVLTKLSYSEATSWWKMLVFKSNFMPNFFTYCLTDFPFPCLEMEKNTKQSLSERTLTLTWKHHF